MRPPGTEDLGVDPTCLPEPVAERGKQPRVCGPVPQAGLKVVAVPGRRRALLPVWREDPRRRADPGLPPTGDSRHRRMGDAAPQRPRYQRRSRPWGRGSSRAIFVGATTTHVDFRLPFDDQGGFGEGYPAASIPLDGDLREDGTEYAWAEFSGHFAPAFRRPAAPSPPGPLRPDAA